MEKKLYIYLYINKILVGSHHVRVLSTGENMVPEPEGQSQAVARGRDREAQDGRGGRGPTAPSAVRQSASAALLPASVRAVRPPAPVAVAAVAPAHHGPPDRAGPATATATAPTATAAATTGRAAATIATSATALVARRPAVRHARLAYPFDGRRTRVHDERLVSVELVTTTPHPRTF